MRCASVQWTSLDSLHVASDTRAAALEAAVCIKCGLDIRLVRNTKQWIVNSHSNRRCALVLKTRKSLLLTENYMAVQGLLV